jgi:hypothetical protein
MQQNTSSEDKSIKNKILEKINQMQGTVSLNFTVPEEIDTIINLSRQQLKSIGGEELSINCIRLAQYALFIKTEINKMKSARDWCEANIDSIIGREISNTNGYGLGEKSLIIKRNDPVAKELESAKIQFASKVTMLEDIDRKIEFLANSMKSLAIEKRV